MLSRHQCNLITQFVLLLTVETPSQGFFFDISSNTNPECHLEIALMLNLDFIIHINTLFNKSFFIMALLI